MKLEPLAAAYTYNLQAQVKAMSSSLIPGG